MAVQGGEVEVVYPLQLRDALEVLLAEGGFPFECVEHDALEEVTETHVVIFRERFQDFEDALLDANPRLYPLDDGE